MKSMHLSSHHAALTRFNLGTSLAGAVNSFQVGVDASKAKDLCNFVKCTGRVRALAFRRVPHENETKCG